MKSLPTKKNYLTSFLVLGRRQDTIAVVLSIWWRFSPWPKWKAKYYTSNHPHTYLGMPWAPPIIKTSRYLDTVLSFQVNADLEKTVSEKLKNFRTTDLESLWDYLMFPISRMRSVSSSGTTHVFCFRLTPIGYFSKVDHNGGLWDQSHCKNGCLSHLLTYKIASIIIHKLQNYIFQRLIKLFD